MTLKFAGPAAWVAAGLALALLAPVPPAWAAAKPAVPAVSTAKQPAKRSATPLPPPRAEFVRELGGISEYRLPNGLQILLFPDEAQSTTTVNITYRVGSRHESQGEYGMAHLLEHMVFKGTPAHQDIAGELAARGVRFNGSTTTDRTNYFASFNASEPTLDFMLRLEADRMLNAFIAKADLDKEMSVVRNEFERGENNPNQVLFQRVQAVAYDWHAYGHSTIGPKSDIENVPIESLQAFYRRHYRPDNATLLVAGRFEPEAVLKRIAGIYGPLPRPAAPLREPYTAEPAQDGERSVVVRRVGGQPMLMVQYHVPAAAHADSAPLMVLGMLMSLQPSGLLYKELVESKLALAAGLGGMGGQGPGAVRAFVALAPDADAAKVEQRLLELLEGRAGKPFDEAELQRVRELALLSYREQMKRPEALIQQISSLLGAGDWRLLFQLMEDLPRVTLDDVERVRRAYLRPANRTLGRYLPAKQVERVEIPAAPALDERLAHLQGPPKLDEGERFDPTPALLEARTERRQLPSGMRLQVLNKRTRGNTVLLQLQLRWGERQAMKPLRGGDLVDDLLTEGSATLDKQKLRDELVRLKAGLRVVGGAQGATLYLSAERDTLLEVLQLAADVLQHPALPADAFERIRQAGLAALRGSREELETKRQEATRLHYNQARGVGFGDADYLPSVEDRLARLQAITLDEVRAFHVEFWSANEAQVAVVGALPAGLDEALERLFGGWKKPQAPRFVRHFSSHVAIPAARFDVSVRDKANASLRMDQRFALNQKDADYLPMLLAVHIFGGGGIESRLSERVRQKEGLSYGVGASLESSYWGQEGGLVISGSFAPQNRERVLALVHEELARMTRDGVSAAELARAKTALLQAALQARANEGQLAGQLNALGEDGRSWLAEQEEETRLQAATLAQVNAAWRRLVKPEGFVISTAGDFDKKP